MPAPNAAFANGPMARAVDMGDTHPQACHISEYVVPALLPAAELRGGVTGKEFITAYALGAEIGSRFGNACRAMETAYVAGRDPQFGIFEATVAVAKLLGLGKDAMQNAHRHSLPSNDHYGSTDVSGENDDGARTPRFCVS